MFWIELKTKIEVIASFVGIAVLILYIIILIIGGKE